MPKLISLCFALALITSAAACEQKAANGRVVDPDNIDGASLYQRKCAVCHGAFGEGDGPGNQNYAFVANLRAPATQERLSDEQIANAVTRGTGQMPRIGGLHELELDALVAHVRTLRAPAPGAAEGVEPEGASEDQSPATH